MSSRRVEIPDRQRVKPKLTSWLEGCAIAPGLLGCCVRLPDGTCVSLSFDANCPQERIEAVLNCISDTLPALANQRLAPRWQTWIFEKGQMRVAERADGLRLGLAVLPNSPASENLDLLTEDFFNLDLTD